jgi:hypothetical protein
MNRLQYCFDSQYMLAVLVGVVATYRTVARAILLTIIERNMVRATV